MTKPLLLSALTALASTGCPLVDLEVGVDQVCVAVPEVRFDGVPPMPGFDGPVSIENSVDIDEQVAELRDTLDDLEVDASLVLQSATATLVPGEDGPTSFAFLHAIDIVVSSPDAEPIAIVQCDDCGLDTTSIDLFAAPTDLTTYVESGAVRLDLAVTGEAPERAWGMEMELCFGASARYRKSL